MANDYLKVGAHTRMALAHKTCGHHGPKAHAPNVSSAKPHGTLCQSTPSTTSTPR